jgi:DNA repair exonuclease SbcCD ATPase subunit
MKRERQKLSRQIADADRALEELLKKRVELRKKWDALEDRAGEAIAREQSNIEELERLEAAACPELTTELDFSQQGFIGQDVLQMDAQSWAMIDRLGSDFFEIPDSQPGVLV